MEGLSDIIKRAVEDYGFRQIAQWSPYDLVERWGLSPAEASILEGPLKREFDLLPVPVEPGDYVSEQARLEAVVNDALGSGSPEPACPELCRRVEPSNDQ